MNSLINSGLISLTLRYARLCCLPALTATLLNVPMSSVQAHHSTGSFDMSHPMVVTGTLKDFRWANPHAWLVMLVPNDKGGVDEWEIEGPSVTMLVRNGWKSSSIHPGEKLHVMIAPRRDGKIGGTFQRVTLENGEVLDTGRLKKD